MGLVVFVILWLLLGFWPALGLGLLIALLCDCKC